MTVHSDSYTLDLQLKATSHPEVKDGHLIHDLDVRTYNLLRSPTRSACGILVLVVVADDTDEWLDMDDDGTRIARSGYFLPLLGLPEVPNEASVRLKVPVCNLLTVEAMQTLMDAEAARWAS